MNRTKRFQWWLVEHKLHTLIRIFLFLKSRFLKTKRKDFWDIQENIEWIKEMNIKQDYSNKKEGISWVARLHNSWEFLELVLESWIDIVDEMIIVNNLSTDNTVEIVDKLIEKYWDKIKYFDYPYEVHCHEWWKHWSTYAYSLHSLPYYYNRSFSKANYNIVTKIDDDDFIFLDDVKKAKLRKKVLGIKEDVFLMYSWYNILKKWDEYWLRWDLKYPGFLWDHWFYRPNKYSTYFKLDRFEHLRIKHMEMKRYGHIYYHFKFLKKRYKDDVEQEYLKTFEKNKRISDAVKGIVE